MVGDTAPQGPVTDGVTSVLDRDPSPTSNADSLRARKAAAEFANLALTSLQEVDGESAGTGVDTSSIEPSLVKLGVAVGILEAVEGQTDSYQLNQAWFENPIEATGDNLEKNGASTAALLADLLGEVAANELGIPSQDLGALGVWNPIPNPKTKKATGFYLVNYPKDPENPNQAQVFGVGILHNWAFTADATDGQEEDESSGPTEIDVRVWGLLPLIQVGNDGLELVLGEAGYPLNMGAMVGGANQQAILDENGLSFNGVKFSALLDIQGDPIIQLSVVLQQLKLPTDTEAADRNLSEILQITPPELLATVSTLCVAALERLLGQDNRAAYLLPIFGLSPVVPNSGVRLPILRWDLLLSNAQQGQSLSTPFVTWFNSLLNTESGFTTWMNAIASLLGSTVPTVRGSGTAADPFAVALLSDEGIGTLSFYRHYPSRYARDSVFTARIQFHGTGGAIRDG